MEIVLDSSSLQNIICSIKPSKCSGISSLSTKIDEPLAQGQLCLVVDVGKGLIDEWGRTCGHDFIHVLVTKWQGIGAVRQVNPVRTLGIKVSRKLHQYGFKDTIDKLMLRIAIVTRDRIIVSEDSDFWDPSDVKRRGCSNSCVASLCRECLGISVLMLVDLMKSLS
jgi:hypothetical protein